MVSINLFKRSFGLIVILFLGMSLSGIIIVASETQNYIYEVNSSEWNQRFGTNQSSAKGFNFLERNYREFRTFEIEADFEFDTTFTMTIGERSKSGACIELIVVGDIYFMPLLPTRIARNAKIEEAAFNSTKVELGPSIWEHFYVSPENSEVFTDIVDSSYEETFHFSNEWTFSQHNGSFVNDTDIAIFSWTVNGQYKNDTKDTDFSGEFEYFYAYNQLTGVMQGYRIFIDYSGKVDGIQVTYQYLQEVEILGFDLPTGKTKLSSGFLGFSVIFPVIIFVILKNKSERQKKVD